MTDSVTNADLAVRIHAVESEVTAVKKAIKATANARRLILLFVILFVVGVCLLFFQLVKRVQSAEFREEALSRAQQHLELNADTYAAEMQKLVEAATPVLTTAVKEQAERDADRYSEVVAQERDRLVKKLRPQLNDMVQARYESGLKGLDSLLSDEFPEAKDPVVQERLRNSVELAMNHMVDQYYLDEMEAQVQTASIRWEGFPTAEAPAAGEPSAANQLIGCLLEMLTRRLSHSDPGR